MELFASKKYKALENARNALYFTSIQARIYWKILWKGAQNSPRRCFRPELILSCEPFRVKVNKFEMILFGGMNSVNIFIIENSFTEDVWEATR